MRNFTIKDILEQYRNSDLNLTINHSVVNIYTLRKILESLQEEFGEGETLPVPNSNITIKITNQPEFILSIFDDSHTQEMLIAVYVPPTKTMFLFEKEIKI